MKKISLLIWILIGFISACSRETPTAKRLTCEDSPKGRPRTEQMAIADACFHRGSFKKSTYRAW